MPMYANNSLVYPMSKEGALLVSVENDGTDRWESWDVIDGDGTFQCTYFKDTDAIVSREAEA